MFCANCPNWDICPENRTGRIGCDIDMSDDFGYVGVEDDWYDGQLPNPERGWA